MRGFAQLLHQLYYTYANKAKTKLLLDYFARTPDPERGFTLAIMANSLEFKFFKRAVIQQLLDEHIDPILFRLSYDYVGDFAETAALLWPYKNDNAGLPTLTEIIQHFGAADKTEIKNYLFFLLNVCDPTERWALLKIGTGSLRIGVSARFLKQALAEFGSVDIHAVEEIWHAVIPPYEDLFAWLEKRAPKPNIEDKIFFHPVMLAHPLEETTELANITPELFAAEWKYDGIRTQLINTINGSCLFSRSGDNISLAFPDVLRDIQHTIVLDGELVVMQEGEIANFNALQQRLNRKSPTKKMLAEFPAHIILYDILTLAGKNLRQLAFVERRKILADWLAANPVPHLSLSPLLTFDSAADLVQLRNKIVLEPNSVIEGLMLKRLDSPYVAGRPTGLWYKWKRDPFLIDAVLMYAQRGHGKRASYYSDYTFGLWRDEQLLPVGKAYSGFTDEELIKLDRWIRQHVMHKFGPVLEVKKQLVFEVAFEAVQLSKRHKSGFALRFPRINRIRWDKPAPEADQLNVLEKLLKNPANSIK